MTDTSAWKRTDQIKLHPGDVVPSQLIDPIFIALQSLIPEDEDDFEEAVEVIEDEEGEVPFESPEAFERKHILEALTFELISSGSRVLKVTTIETDTGDQLISVYGGTYGAVVGHEKVIAKDEQGNIWLVPEDDPDVAQRLRDLVHG